MPMDHFPLTQQVRGQIGMTILLTITALTLTVPLRASPLPF